MGLFDTLDLPAALSLPNLDRDPAAIEWQTKSIDHPRMKTYRITAEGLLLEEEVHTESVPKAERPYYGTDEWDENPMLQAAGSLRQVHDGWSVRQYHGIVEFHRCIDDEYVSYEARFTDGQVEELRQGKPIETGWHPFGTLVDAPTVTPPARLSTTEVIHLRALLDDLAKEIAAFHRVTPTDHTTTGDRVTADQYGGRWQAARSASLWVGYGRTRGWW